MAKEIKFKKKQIGITPRFAYIKYKVQGAMFKSKTLGLQQKIVNRIAEIFKRFCSIYMQLLRL